MTSRAVLCAAVLLLAQSQIAGAQCVSYDSNHPRNNVATVGVVAGTGWSGAPYGMPNIAAGIDRWTTSCDDYIGTDMPTLLANSNGAITITVDYVSGNAPHPNDPTACADFDANVDSNNRITGGSARFFERDYNGTSCVGYTDQSGRNGILAHELGHALGLNNTPCAGYIMGPTWPAGTANEEECQWVSDRWDVTPRERCESGTGSSGSACSGECTSTGWCWEPDPTTGCYAPNDPACPPSWYNDPLILDMEGDGISTTTVDHGVDFDISGDGMLERVAWTVAGAEDAILYFDHNHNRVIDGVRELFGDATILPDGTKSRHGFEALAVYDRNGDDAITPSDGVWGKLRLWIDRDHDGIMSNDENYALSEQKIIRLDLGYVATTAADGYGIDEAGNQHRLKGTFSKRSGSDGKTLPMHDVFLRWRLR